MEELKRKSSEKVLARARKWYYDNKQRVRDRQIKKKFGMTPEEYDQKLKSQFGSCELCDRIFDYNLCVDHDHKTGKNRGLLCFTCNAIVGHYELGNLPSEESIKDYLRRHK